MKCWKTEGAFLRPKDITRYSKWPNTQGKTILYSWPLLILIRLKASCRSIFKNIFPFRSFSSIQMISGRGKELGKVISFSRRSSSTSLSSPFFISTKNIGAPMSDLDFLINSLANISWCYLRFFLQKLWLGLVLDKGCYSDDISVN